MSWNPPGGNSYAIHMALVSGDGAPYHSRILWFRGQSTAGFQGGEWGWTTGAGDCASYPGSNFTALPIGPPGMDVFCAGHSSLGDGRIFVPGGTDPVTGHYGENKTRIYTPGTGTNAGSWSTPPDMVDWRWYPTATTLPDGRVLTTGGNRHPQHRVFGGKRNGSPPSTPLADSVYRFAPIDGGAWEPAVLPALDPTENPGRPAVREGHTSVDMGGYSNWDGANVVFGGRRENGAAVSDTWFLIRENPATGDDYSYRWSRRAKSGLAPAARSEHAAAPLAGSTMVLHGGRHENGTGFSDTWVLSRIGGVFEWQPVSTYGTAPSARFGHGGFVSKMNVKQADGSIQETSRLIVFGGTSSAGSSPTDPQVYELRLDSTSPAVGGWRTMNVVDLGFGQPAPRHGHGFVRVEPEGTVRDHPSQKKANTAVLVGGQLDATTYSNEVWVLWAFDDSTVGWEKKTFGGVAPAARARAGVLVDFDQGQAGGRLYVSGGENASGGVDANVHVVDLWKPGASWQSWIAFGANLTGQTVTRDRDWTHARRSEVYEPATGTRIAYANAPFGWRHTYPLLFTVPGGPGSHGRIVAAGHEAQTYWLDLPAPGQQPAVGQGWKTLTGVSTGFDAETAVQYRPGYIFVAGGRLGSTVVGTSKTLNAANLSGGWTTSQAMLPRAYHNLVLLPNGKVLALGGNGTTGQTNDAPVRKPQLWDPDGNGGLGTWTDPDALEIQPTIRGYHSTALLLPDGRLLSAGGENHPDKYLANLYCPPYLFKGESDTLAVRPVVTSGPSSTRSGRHFSISVTDTTGIRKVVLVRPGATTHAFDENQRHVPLAFTKSGNPSCLEVSAPASLDEAPVGDYMLFVVGSKDGPEVPSVATWIRIDPPTTDAASPGKVTTLTIENIARTSAAIGWYAPGDDGFTGTAQSYELKYSRDPINACNFEAADNAPVIPAPAPANEYQCIEIDGLLSCKTYHFALRATDDAGNRSLVSGVVSGATTCSGNTYALCSGTGLMAQGGDGTAENSLFAETAGAVDRIVLRDAPALTAGQLTLRLAKGGPGHADVDRVTLGFVDQPTSARLYEGPDRVWSGSRSEVAAVTDANGVDRTAALGGASPPGLRLDAGAVLTVSLPAATSATRLLIEATRDAASLESDATGIVVERPDGPGSWRETARLHPRRIAAPFAAPVEGSSTVRVRMLAPYRLRSLARLDAAQGRSLDALDLETATHSRLGDVRTAVSSNGGSSAVLHAGETLDLGFEAPRASATETRTFVLEVRGAYTTSGGSSGVAGLLSPQAAEIPLRFAGAHPNPSVRGTVLTFSHPERARVLVRVFDVRGRVLAKVLDDEIDGGEHAIAWDGFDAAGRRLDRGVYFARMEREGWRSERKLVLVGP